MNGIDTMTHRLHPRRASRVSWPWSLALALQAATPQAPAAKALFDAPFLSFDTGARPYSVATGDLDGDKRPDLVVANQASRTVSVLLQIGDGDFVAKMDFPTASAPLSVAIGDLNGDEQADIAIANGSNTVSVLLVNGDGTFQPRVDFPTGLGPFSIAIADLSGDGRPDLAVACADANAVSVHLGNGDGTFRPRSEFGTGGTAISVAVGDLNGDGRPDLAAANNGSNTVAVLLGNGDGTFRPKNEFGTGTIPFSVAIGDLNGDGRPDLAVANAGSVIDTGSTVSVLLGNGDGSFAPRTDFAAGARPISVAIGDLNGDARLDLAVANAGSSSAAGSTVSVLLGNGDGTFGPKTDFETGRAPQSVAIGDVSGDALPDLAVANLGSNSVSVLLGNGDGSFGTKRDFGTGILPVSVAIGDLNRDRQPDLAIANGGSFSDPGSTLSVLLGNGAGVFGPRCDFAVGRGPSSVAIGDLNADGRGDLVAANSVSNTVSVLLGNGDGTFRAKSDFGTGSSPISVVIADLSGDRRPDLVVANAGSFSAPDSTLSVFLGNGDGTFGLRTDVATGVRPFSVAVEDLNGDDRLDLVVANFGATIDPGSTVSVFLGNGDGTFQRRTDFGTGIGPSAVAIGDLNGDGRQDLAVTNLLANTVSVLLGNGDGSFGPDTVLRTGRGVVSVAIADLNGDLRPDVAIATRGTNTVTVFFGNGDGTFGSKADFGTGIAPNFVAIGDLNRDDRPDIAASNQGSTVTVLLNQGTNQVAVEVEDLSAEASGGRVQLHWRLSSQANRELQGIDVQRATAAGGPYTVRNAELLPPAIEMSFEDAELEGGGYWYRLVLVSHGGSREIVGPVGIQIGSGAPSVTALYPPFETAGGGPIQIRYSLAADRTPVHLAIHDVRGRRIWSSESNVRESGVHTQTWDRRDRFGTLVSNGIYFVRLDAGGIVVSKKLMLVHR
jgi:hypothetical protein